jgi:hypothetical protein
LRQYASPSNLSSSSERRTNKYRDRGEHIKKDIARVKTEIRNATDALSRTIDIFKGTVIRSLFLIHCGGDDYLSYARRLKNVVTVLDSLHFVPYEAVPQGRGIDSQGNKEQK